jgi:glycosyltransferase involved in cell wall biosynthesis
MTTIYPPCSNDYSKIKKQKDEFTGTYNLRTSIVIPFYRNIIVLERTLASLTKQTYPKNLFEIILSLDGSPEEVDVVINRFRDKVNIRCISQHREGHRVASARNKGIIISKGDVILSLDFDMICPPDFIETHMIWFHVSDRVATIGPRKFIEAAHVRIDDITANFDLIKNQPSVASVSNRQLKVDQRLSIFEEFTSCMYPGNFFYGCNVGYRKNQALDIGGFDEDYNSNPNYEDIDFGHRLWLSGIFLVAETNALCFHQENHVVTLEQRAGGGQINREKLYRKFPELIDYRKRLGQP